MKRALSFRSSSKRKVSEAEVALPAPTVVTKKKAPPPVAAVVEQAPAAPKPSSKSIFLRLLAAAVVIFVVVSRTPAPGPALRGPPRDPPAPARRGLSRERAALLVVAGATALTPAGAPLRALLFKPPPPPPPFYAPAASAATSAFKGAAGAVARGLAGLA